MVVSTTAHAQEEVLAQSATPAQPASATGGQSLAATANADRGKTKASGDTHGDAVTMTVPGSNPPVSPPPPAPAIGANEATSLLEMFTKGHFYGNFRTEYFTLHNAYFVPASNQDTVSYGGTFGYKTAALYGFSVGVSAFLQRGIDHSDNPSQVVSYLGPNLLNLGEAYLQYEGHGFKVVAGNQELDAPFDGVEDWRIVPPLFQGVLARYGDADNFVEAFKMFRYKSYTSNTFTRTTAYNVNFDSFSKIGNAETNGLWGVGGGHKWDLAPVELSAQGWYQTYQDYARMTYATGQVIRDSGLIRPFVGVQGIRETGDGRELLGNINSQVFGAQFGVKRNSLTLSFGYDRIVPHSNSFLNGALVTPYAHNIGSDPLYAQPFFTSTEDLGAGNAYAIDLKGAPFAHWFLGARYSFMDLKSSATAVSLNQSEYLLYAIYNFSGKLKGLSITDFGGMQSTPTKSKKYFENRVILEYAFGS
ncbi:OprD family outer membrane porin [Trinickia mobilis]|uniref:OprD family outer membrane porin n=1 Tax=Trinickia mobilis TaxID=2816356 RepID=UPI001A8E181C|nr:OprD family outer membrane porin [Trinickia mobilis]